MGLKCDIFSMGGAAAAAGDRYYMSLGCVNSCSICFWSNQSFLKCPVWILWGMMSSIVLLQSMDNRLLWPHSFCNCHPTQSSLILNVASSVITTQFHLFQAYICSNSFPGIYLQFCGRAWLHISYLWSFDFLKPGQLQVIEVLCTITLSGKLSPSYF